MPHTMRPKPNGELSMKFTTLIAGAALAFGLATTAFADGHEKTKVGFVFVGPVGD